MCIRDSIRSNASGFLSSVPSNIRTNVSGYLSSSVSERELQLPHRKKQYLEDVQQSSYIPQLNTMLFNAPQNEKHSINPNIGQSINTIIKFIK